MADLGVSFNPGGPSAVNGPNGQPAGGSRPSPIQQAIQLLSLRLPKTVGAGAIAPQPLLQAPGGGGLGGNPNSAAMLEMIRQMLFGDRQIGTPGHAVPGATIPDSQPGAFQPYQPGGPSGPDLTPHFSPVEGNTPTAPPPPQQTPAGPTSPPGQPYGNDTRQDPMQIFDMFRP